MLDRLPWSPGTSLQDALIETIKRLPEDQQAIVKALADQLAQAAESQARGPTAGWLGCLEHLGVQITAEKIDEARREIWGTFPRDIEP